MSPNDLTSGSRHRPGDVLRQLVRPSFPYQFSVDGSQRRDGVSADFDVDTYRGMSFLRFRYLAITAGAVDYRSAGVSYTVAGADPKDHGKLFTRWEAMPS